MGEERLPIFCLQEMMKGMLSHAKPYVGLIGIPANQQAQTKAPKSGSSTTFPYYEKDL